jgi:hypothetical protein
VTTYAYDPAQRQLLAVWPLGTGYHAAVITHVNDRGDAGGLAVLCEELTRLSHELWDTATPSPPAQPSTSRTGPVALTENGREPSAGSAIAYLVEAGSKSEQEHLPGALHYGIKDPSLVIAHRNGVLIKLLVVLSVGVSGGILQQLFDALVDQLPRVFGEVGILFLSLLTTRLQRVARHLPTNPVPVFALVPGAQSTEVTGLRAFELLAFLVGEWVRCHYGHRLPVLQNRLRSREVNAICGQRQGRAKRCLKLRAPLGRVSEQCRPDRWTRSLNRPWRVIGRTGRDLRSLVAAHSQSNEVVTARVRPGGPNTRLAHLRK